MNEQPLSGARIAVLVESQYIPSELRKYQERFAEYGANVDLVSRLWGQPSLRFYSTVEPDQAGDAPQLEWIEVGIDVDEVDLAAYDAVIATANYTSVRLRHVEPPPVGTPQQAVRDAPAVRFVRRAMTDPRVVTALPCHALWLLTPMPELIAGRKVTCNPVVLADVLNAGGHYVPPGAEQPDSEQVVVDGDLVTSTSWLATDKLIDTVRDLVLARREPAKPPSPAAAAAAAERSEGAPEDRTRVLVVLSEWGYWGEELIGPVDVFDRAGYQVSFCTPNGKRPNAIPASMDADFLDPPLGRPVTTEAVAGRVRQFDDPATPEGSRLNNPIDLSSWFPQRPYFAASAFVRLLEAYNRDLERAEREVRDRYDALLIVGGSGPIVDLANNQRVHDLILAFHKLNRPIAAECYGVTCLAFARDLNERRSIIAGKNVTGHCLEYDYQDGTGFVESRGTYLPFNMGPPPYPLEFILRDATASGGIDGHGQPDGHAQGGYHGNFGHPTSVIVDYPFITGRSTPDSTLTGEKLVEVLAGTLTRWGW
jgi:putative intracellular protease/amidase